ncbi:MAG: sialate O-acetylesterase [Clostridia bacterium]|nr:sialate O-acetylesterase [Clostridia bacterium]
MEKIKEALFGDGLNVESNDEIRSFLLIGQSNMAGRGEYADVAPIQNENCFMLRMGRWQKMSEPINVDRGIFDVKPKSGVGPGASFADSVANAYGWRVGLVSCADGGTKLSQWMPGEILYDHAVMMTKLAKRTSRLAGILWHQGESDCGSEEMLLTYKERFMAMITAMRKELGAEDLPLLIGELSENLKEKYNQEQRPKRLNVIFHEIARELPNTAVVSAKDLALKPDGIHFSAVAQREFGKRYFEALDGMMRK